MRMDPSDVSDVTGSTYRYLVNGHGPADNWTGCSRRASGAAAAGQRLGDDQLQYSHTGLPLTVVQADDRMSGR